MPGNEYQDCLRMGRADRRVLFETLKHMETPRASSKRKFNRLEFPGVDVAMTLFGPTASESHDYLTLSRNLSASGISVLHGGFVYPGTTCILRIPTLQGDVEAIKADVMHCRLVRGRVHELGLRFERVIETHCFVADNPSGGTLSPHEAAQLAGAALLLDDHDAEHARAADHLKDTDVTLLGARTAQEMLDILGETTIDLLICDIELGDDAPSGIDAMRDARDAGYRGPILAVTAQPSPEHIRRAKEHGVVGMLLKPYPGDKLLSGLASHLGTAAARPPRAA